MRPVTLVVPALAMAVLFAGPAPCPGQTTASSPDGRFDVAIGGTWIGGGALGGAAATLTPNQGTARYTLFTTTADLTTQTGGDLRLGYRVTRALLASVSAGLTRGAVEVGVGGDAEGAPDIRFVGDRLLQWQLEGRIDFEPSRLRFANGRARPFVMVSGGVLRQRHESHVSIESGRIVQAGAGLSVMLRERPARRISGVGVTVEVRASRVSGGFQWGRGARTVPAFGVGFLTRWGHRQGPDARTGG